MNCAWHFMEQNTITNFKICVFSCHWVVFFMCDPSDVKSWCVYVRGMFFLLTWSRLILKELLFWMISHYTSKQRYNKREVCSWKINDESILSWNTSSIYDTLSLDPNTWYVQNSCARISIPYDVSKRRTHNKWLRTSENAAKTSFPKQYIDQCVHKATSYRKRSRVLSTPMNTFMQMSDPCSSRKQNSKWE